MHTNNETSVPPPVIRLCLSFSTAADDARIRAALDPALREKIDPEHHVADRLTAAFNKAVAQGCIAILKDDAGAVKSLTVAYHCHLAKDPAEDAPHDHINFGTSLSYLPGYKISAVAIAALALREWLLHPPLGEEISAGIADDNIASLKIYNEKLKWEKLEDPEKLKPIMGATWHTLPDPRDATGQTPRDDAPENLAGVGWYMCDKRALMTQAHYLLRLLKNRGRIESDKGAIEIDLVALAREGLTKARLEAIGSGVTSRKAIMAIRR